MRRPRYAVIEAPSVLGLFPGGVERLPEALLAAGLADRLGRAARGPGRAAAVRRPPGPGDPPAQPWRDRGRSREISPTPWRPSSTPASSPSCSVATAPSCSAVCWRCGVATATACSFSTAMPTSTSPKRSRTAKLPRWSWRWRPVVDRRSCPTSTAAVHWCATPTSWSSADETAARPRPTAAGAWKTPTSGWSTSTRSVRTDAPTGRRPSARHLSRPELSGFWMHLDADVLDDDLMPAVDYRIPGGLVLGRAGRDAEHAPGVGPVAWAQRHHLQPRSRSGRHHRPLLRRRPRAGSRPELRLVSRWRRAEEGRLAEDAGRPPRRRARSGHPAAPSPASPAARMG